MHACVVDWQAATAYDMVVTRYSDELCLAAGKVVSINGLRDCVEVLLSPWVDFSQRNAAARVLKVCYAVLADAASGHEDSGREGGFYW